MKCRWRHINSQSVPKVITIHPEGHMIVCTKFHPIKAAVSVTLHSKWIQKCYDGTTSKRRSLRITKIVRVHSSGSMNTYSNFNGNLSDSWMLLLNYYSGGLTNQHVAIPKTMQLAWLKTCNWQTVGFVVAVAAPAGVENVLILKHETNSWNYACVLIFLPVFT